MIADLLIHHIGELLTPYHEAPVKGEAMQDVLRIRNAFVAIKEGRILDFGSGDPSRYAGEGTIWYDAEGCILLPGFIDGHTHLVFGGSREQEFALKVAGVPYLEILKKGGGILSTVDSTRKATKEELTSKALASLDRFLEFGVTTLEAKSGYGLDLETEIKTLEVMAELNEIHPIDIVPTYLGAHAIPKEFKNDRGGYMQKMIEVMKIVKSRNLAVFADVFCEDGVFSPAESLGLLEAAREIGLIPKIHADEIVSTGGAGIAVALQAASADHLMAVSEEDIAKLAASSVIANLLPGTSFYLNKEYADARKMIASGLAIGIASDYNPGSSPSENFQLILQLAAGKLRMTPEEILTASTINPAYQLGLSSSIGTIALGKKADLVVMNAPNWEFILYHYGINHTKAVFKNGVQVVQDGRRIQGGKP